jgi:preprotein translocase subunit SecE
VAMNRQHKRMMARQGMDKPKAPDRRAAAAPPPHKEKRPGVGEYLGEVRSEMRKVAWPTRKEVANSTVIVLIAVIVMGALIFLFDYSSAKFVLFLFD